MSSAGYGHHAPPPDRADAAGAPPVGGGEDTTPAAAVNDTAAQLAVEGRDGLARASDDAKAPETPGGSADDETATPGEGALAGDAPDDEADPGVG